MIRLRSALRRSQLLFGHTLGGIRLVVLGLVVASLVPQLLRVRQLALRLRLIDLLRMARHGRILDWAGESQYYVEPKRLAKLGYLTARTEPGKTRQRTVYTLTDKGLEALAAWARTAVRFTPAASTCPPMSPSVPRSSTSRSWLA